MTIIIKTIILTVISFVATNIDDLVIDTFFFTEIKNKKDIKIVVFGKYLGLGFLVLVSIIASFGLNFIPYAYIRYLGFIPLYLGIKEIIHNKDDEEVKPDDKNEEDKNVNEEVNMNDDEKAIELAKKQYGTTDGVYFRIEQMQSNNVYIVSVRNSETTRDLAWYTVDVKNGTVK